MAKSRSIIEEKVWGTKHNLFYSNYVVIDRLYIAKGGYCSLHSHEHKYNRFYVESGKLLIQLPNGKFYVGPNEEYKLFDVYPKIVHQFRAIEETICIEIVYVKVLEKDINRLTEGGVLE